MGRKLDTIKGSQNPTDDNWIGNGFCLLCGHYHAGSGPKNCLKPHVIRDPRTGLRRNILDIPEHERRFPSHPDTLRGKEETVIEAAIEYDLRAYEHLQADHPRSECDLPACIAWWQAGDKLSKVTRALIAARKERE